MEVMLYIDTMSQTTVYNQLYLVKSEYHGKGVKKAIANVNDKLAPLFVGKDLNIADQTGMDKLMLDLDGTPSKSNLGILDYLDYLNI